MYRVFQKKLYTLGKPNFRHFVLGNYQSDLKLWQQGVLMSTPCCQKRPNSNWLVVSEYEGPKVWFSQECKVFCEPLCININICGYTFYRQGGGGIWGQKLETSQKKYFIKKNN